MDVKDLHYAWIVLISGQKGRESGRDVVVVPDGRRSLKWWC